MLETPVQSRVRLEAARLGLTMFRNNNGACYDDTGRLIRYGLGNDSEQLNRVIKSSDLIGFTPLVIEQQHVGSMVAVFTAIECKQSDWHMTPSDVRAQAQLRFMDLVRANGGLAGFARGPDDVTKILMRQT